MTDRFAALRDCPSPTRPFSSSIRGRERFARASPAGRVLSGGYASVQSAALRWACAVGQPLEKKRAKQVELRRPQSSGHDWGLLPRRRPRWSPSSPGTARSGSDSSNAFLTISAEITIQGLPASPRLTIRKGDCAGLFYVLYFPLGCPGFPPPKPVCLSTVCCYSATQ